MEGGCLLRRCRLKQGQAAYKTLCQSLREDGKPSGGRATISYRSSNQPQVLGIFGWLPRAERGQSAGIVRGWRQPTETLDGYSVSRPLFST
jgi:hypothetical protein